MTKKKVKKAKKVEEESNYYGYDIDILTEESLPTLFCKSSELISKFKVIICNLIEDGELQESDFPLAITIFNLTNMTKIAYEVKNILTFSEIPEIKG